MSGKFLIGDKVKIEGDNIEVDGEMYMGTIWKISCPEIMNYTKCSST